MSVEIIGVMILKSIICLVVLYLIAGFFISFNRLLPFFAIVTSIAVIVFSFFAYKNESIRWIPFFLSLLAQIFYHGEGYMTPKVQENLYKLVKVERRYESLFASNDTYELHFAPVEMGGFLVNTLIYAVFFIMVYEVAWGAPSYGWAYVVPTYVICMSIMDILYMHGFPVTDLIHIPVKIIVCIFAVYIGFMVSPSNGPTSIKTEKLYNQCNEVAKIDYSKSYEIEYITKIKEGYDYVVVDETNFVYDSTLEAGAFYYTQDDNTIYTRVIYKDFYSNKLVEYSNTNTQMVDFVFEKYATIVGGPFKYVTMDQPFDTYTAFSRDMFFNSTQLTKYNGGFSIIYSRDISADSHYSIVYYFETNEKGKPVSVSGIDCSIYTGENLYEITYDPVSGKTGLENLFNEYKTLNYGFLYNDTEKYEIDLEPAIGSLTAMDDIGDLFDFTLKETYNGSSSMYVYDSDREVVGLYTSNYQDSHNAIATNDFYTYMPNYYIFNDYEIIQNTSDWNISDSEDVFEKYTYDNEFATKVIKEGFLAFDDIMTENVTIDEDITIVSLVCFHNAISDNDFITYDLYYKEINGEYEIYKIELNTTYENREYSLTVYYDDVFNIM